MNPPMSTVEDQHTPGTQRNDKERTGLGGSELRREILALQSLSSLNPHRRALGELGFGGRRPWARGDLLHALRLGAGLLVRGVPTGRVPRGLGRTMRRRVAVALVGSGSGGEGGRDEGLGPRECSSE